MVLSVSPCFTLLLGNLGLKDPLYIKLLKVPEYIDFIILRMQPLIPTLEIFSIKAGLQTESKALLKSTKHAYKY